MIFKKKIIVFLICILCMPFIIQNASANQQKTKAGQIIADNLNYNEEIGEYIAIGEVYFELNEHNIKAEKITINQNNIVARRNDATKLTLNSLVNNIKLFLEADKLKLNVSRNNFEAKNIYMEYDNKEIRGEKLKYNEYDNKFSIYKAEIKEDKDNWIKSKKITMNLDTLIINAKGEVESRIIIE